MYDLIYTDPDGRERGVLSGYAMTMTFGDVDNDFDCVFGTQGAPALSGGCMLYAESTEYGGIVREVSVSTQDGTTTFSGPTWHGVINEHFLRPPAGQTHLRLRGDAHEALRTIVAACGLSEWFRVADGDSGIEVSADVRYQRAYDTMVKTLGQAHAKLLIKWRRDHAELSAVPAVEHDQMNSDNANFTIDHGYRPPNHILLLGKGEMLERNVAELYVQADGTIGTTQHFFGLDHVETSFEDTNAEMDELVAKGTKELLALQDADAVDVSSELVDDYDVGDYVTVTNLEAGRSATAVVSSKTVTLIDGEPTFSCEIGSASALFGDDEGSQ